MASVRLFHSQIESGRLPNLCICCGAPATLRRRHKFWSAPFSRIMMYKHYFAGTSMNYVRGLYKREIVVPLCEQHRHRLAWPLYMSFGIFALLFLFMGSFVTGVCGGAFVAGLGWFLPIAGLCFVTLIASGIAFSFVRLYTPQYCDLTDQYIELNCISEQFAAAAQAFGAQPTASASLGEGLAKGYHVYAVVASVVALGFIGAMILVLIGLFGGLGGRAASEPSGAAAFKPSPAEDEDASPFRGALLMVNFERDGFAEFQNATAVRDGSSRRFHGVLTGTRQPQIVAGKAGTALRFDGRDDRIVIPRLRDALAGGAKQLTVAAWVRVEKEAGDGFVFNAGHHGGSEIALYHSDDEVVFSLAAKHGGANLAAPRDKTPGWHHWAGVWDGKEQRLYVDGRRVAVQPTTIAALNSLSLTSEVAHVGATAKIFRREERHFQGAIDELLLLPRAFDDVAIHALYQRGQENRPIPVFKSQ